ncbi:MAG: Ribosomal protein methylthiotransferase RimO [Actinomycetota bacterium]
MAKKVHLITLGCSRNETDSAELASILVQSDWQLTENPEEAEAIVVNTCGFIDSAKKDSIDTILAAHDVKMQHGTKAVVAVGCMAERYGKDLADELEEADAVIGFDQYPQLGSILSSIVQGEKIQSHTPFDRRTLLSKTPTLRNPSNLFVPGHGSSDVVRVRLDSKPYSPLKIASGCDRRCTFCAIPRFRGAYVSRKPVDIIAEAAWLSSQGVKELLLVSENSTSYGKDLGEVRLLEILLAALSEIEGIERIRISYLQPAEVRPGLFETIIQTPKVTNYFDLSFQHASPSVLRSMRRFGDAESFLGLISEIRSLDPVAAVRSNVIVGFPGESESDVQTLLDFIAEAKMDTVGVFPYSNEENTEAMQMEQQIPAEEIHHRFERVSRLVEEISQQRSEERVGEIVDVLFDTTSYEGRNQYQAPEIDGITRVNQSHAAGSIVKARVREAQGVDLIAEIL